MKINDMTLGELKEINSIFTRELVKEHPYQIGKNYLIRTVTMIQVGKLKAVYDTELLLENASWVADTDNFNEALSKGIENLNGSEIEMFINDVVVGRGAIIDATIYDCNLPTKNK